MFGLFKKIKDRAATAYIASMIKPLGELPGSAFRDPYCLGFLEIVGMHSAVAMTKRLSSEQAAEAFAAALNKVVPEHAPLAVQILAQIRPETSPDHEAYLRGVRDGDMFMGYRLHRLASQGEGEAALKRFTDYLKNEHNSDGRSPPPAPPIRSLEPGAVRVEWDDWMIVGNELVRQYDFEGFPFADKVMFQIKVTAEAGSLNNLHFYPHFVMRPPISPEREIQRTILFGTDDGEVKFLMDATVARVRGEESMFWFFGAENAKKILQVLYAAKMMRFSLVGPDGEKIEMVLPLENDGTYREVLAKIQKQKKPVQ